LYPTTTEIPVDLVHPQLFTCTAYVVAERPIGNPKRIDLNDSTCDASFITLVTLISSCETLMHLPRACFETVAMSRKKKCLAVSAAIFLVVLLVAIIGLTLRIRLAKGNATAGLLTLKVR
jgi:hypothetical protein